jgi:Domain of unknown function (DUF4159)
VRVLACAALTAIGVTIALAQMPFREYESLEPFDVVELPADWQVPGEFVFARLMYPAHPRATFARMRGRTDWEYGGTSWAQDYPRADRFLASAMRRLTRVHARSVEQPINLNDGDDVFNWPWLCAGELGDWKLTDSMIIKLRDYLDRGGMLFLDDFWGTQEWNRFNETMSRVFPYRVAVEMDDQEPMLHMLYDLEDRYTVPGQWALRTGSTYRNDGQIPHWRAIYDDKGRVMVAIWFNNDLGDAWEWADNPLYPERYSALALRIAANHIVYSMSH